MERAVTAPVITLSAAEAIVLDSTPRRRRCLVVPICVLVQILRP